MSDNYSKERWSRRWIPAACFFACLALAVVAVYLVYHCEKCPPETSLALLVGYGTLILLFFFGLMVLMAIATGEIDLASLLSEAGPAGKTRFASLSRFQLLIFTFVIGMSFFLVTVYNKNFPTHIPPEILTLLGISASTYAVSKGIQSSSIGAAGEEEAKKVTSFAAIDPATGRITNTEHDPTTGQTRVTVHDPATGQTTTTLHSPAAITTTTRTASAAQQDAG